MTVALGIDIDLSTDFLEDRLTDNCKCESFHTDPRNRVCSELVTARFACCEVEMLVCDRSVAYARDTISNPFAFCALCEEPASVCWRVTPA